MRRLLAFVAAAAFALGGCGSGMYVGTEEGDPAVDGFRCAQPTGPSGMLEMRPSCDTHDAKEVSSQHPGTRRYNRDVVRAGRYANEIYFVYEGACTVLRFDLAATGAELRGAEFAGALGFVFRDELDRQIRAATDDRLTLDPAG